MALLLSSPTTAGDRLALADGTGVFLLNAAVATDYQVSATATFAVTIIDRITQAAYAGSDVNIGLTLAVDPQAFAGEDLYIVAIYFIWGAMDLR